MSYNEVQRREILAFVQRIALIELVAWERPNEDVVTMSKADCTRLLDVLEEARIIAAKYAGLPIP